ncbi:MAG: Amuc_1100 family pilus-like protein, partial [Verrucomicrobiae bacterium]|nr:Amuc_1100 family pilus-like protein [Verrucomicrobiae bacterium]
SEFTNQILKGKVSDFLKLASEKKMELEKRDDFYMGFDAYRTTFPRPEVVSALNYQLEAVEHLLNSLAESGVDRLNFLTREQLPGEEQTADAVAATGIVKGEVVQKYPITLGFVADHRDFQEFVNRIANDKDYFFILRVLRVDNSSPGGPSFETEGGLGQSAWLKPDGIEATQTEMEEMGMGTLPYDEFSKKAIEAGWQQKRQDARIIFGQEKLEVFTVIDLVRFLSPDEVDEGSGEGKEPEVDSKKNGR